MPAMHDKGFRGRHHFEGVVRLIFRAGGISFQLDAVLFGSPDVAFGKANFSMESKISKRKPLAVQKFVREQPEMKLLWRSPATSIICLMTIEI